MSVPEVRQSLAGSGTGVEVGISALVSLIGAEAKALSRVGFKVLDLRAAMKGA